MNRRTFLKLTGVAVAAGVSNLSFAGEEQQWIRLINRQPKVGQKIILLSKALNYKDRNGEQTKTCMISVGERVSLRNSKNKLGDKLPLFALRREFRISNHSFSNNRLFYYTKSESDYSLEDIRKLKWAHIDEEMMLDEYKNNICLFWMLDNTYWIPVVGKLPESLPQIPEYRKIRICKYGELNKIMEKK